MLDGYTRVKECPVCGKGRCLVSNDGAVAICWRVSEGSFKTGDRGTYIHKLEGDTKPKGTPVKARTEPEHDHDYWHRWISIARMRYEDSGLSLGKYLGLSDTSLVRLGLGLLGRSELKEMNTACRDMSAWAFPMVNEFGRPIGIRLRTRSAFKYACDGSQNGLFIPLGVERSENLHICEGPTDTAAMLDMGCDAIGRPMNAGLEGMIADAVKRLSPRRVTIVIDRDEPGGVAAAATRRGAVTLSMMLSASNIPNGIIRPPGNHKDMRDALTDSQAS